SRKSALRLAIPPSQHPPGPQRVPAAGFTKLFQFEVGLALVTILQRPSAVLALAAADNLDRLGEAWVSLRVDRLEIVQSAENVVVPTRWEGEGKEDRLDHFASPMGAKQPMHQEEFT